MFAIKLLLVYLGLRTDRIQYLKTENPVFMKRRVRKIANFFAFNLLFFALYLNFIHKDKVSAPGAGIAGQQNTAAFSGTVLVETPDEISGKKNEASVTSGQSSAQKNEQGNTAALKLSIN